MTRKFQAMLDLLSKLDPDAIDKLSTINTSMEAIALQKAHEQADAVSAKFNDVFNKLDHKLQQKKKKRNGRSCVPSQG